MYHYYLFRNKDENAHRFALSSIRGELLEREREKEIDSFGILYTGYLFSLVKIKKGIEREGEREQQIINKLKSSIPLSEVKWVNLAWMC